MAKPYRNRVVWENKNGNVSTKSFPTEELAIAFYRALRQRERYRPRIARVYKQWDGYRGKIVYGYMTAYRTTDGVRAPYDTYLDPDAPQE
jgi:hypothetical protein